MYNAYDYTGADRLIPLIRMIHREMRERADAIRGINIQLHRQQSATSLGQPTLAEFSEVNLLANLSNHKREIRKAEKELTRLGCCVDGDNPFRVLIPGANGEIENGYAWRVGDEKVSAVLQGGPGEAA
jgi:hypothetical protein